MIIGVSMSKLHIDQWLVWPWLDGHDPKSLHNKHGKPHTLVLCDCHIPKRLCNDHGKPYTVVF